jgi:type IV pilus assembly protein PilX
MGPNSLAGNRVCTFDSKKPAEFSSGCGTGTKVGMCLTTTVSGDAWKTVKALYLSETGTTNTNKTVEFGQYTGQVMSTGSSGLPAKRPRYIIEAVRYGGTGFSDDNVGTSGNTGAEYAFLVTAMGFGTRTETQVMLQALVYKPANKPNSGC